MLADSRSRRRDREASLSRDRKRKREKDSKDDRRGKDEKRARDDKHDRRDDRGRGDDRKRGDHGDRDRRDGRDGDRGRGGRQGDDARKLKEKEKEKESEPEEVDEIPPIEQASDTSKAAKKDWREEMGGEDERDLSDDEDETARKLAESRKRREAMMAKKREEEQKAKEEGEVDDTETAGVVKESNEAEVEDSAPGVVGEKADSDSDAGAADTKKEESRVSKEQKEEVTKFILEQKAVKEKEEQGDMFGDGDEAAKLNKQVKQQASAIGVTGASGDDWNDQDGYYLAKIGEVMDDRFLVVENVCGKGVFSNVVKCKDKQHGDQMVAIKVMRENDMMKKAAEKEIEILNTLNKRDKDNKRHVIRLLNTFYYRKHLCLVFECMGDDLRAALKKYTKGKGMALQAIRAYTKQLMVGLRHMHRCGIIHADIKPDNILISENHNVVKFCDLGTALELKDAAVTPYLVSRFYRAPEIIVGAEYSVPVDVFALGATLFEMFTAKILFNSKSNNDALRKIMEVKGKIPKNVIRRGMLWKTHFDDNLEFKYVDVDKYTKQEVNKTITDFTIKKDRDIFELLLERVGKEKLTSDVKEDTQTIKRIKQLADLIHQMLALDPEKRVTANDALNHSFLEDRLGKGVADSGGNRR